MEATIDSVRGRAIRWDSASAAVGAAIWAIALVGLRPTPLDVLWAKALLLLAALVLVPLVLRLFAPAAGAAGDNRLWALIRVTQLPAAVLLGAAFLMPQGPIAAGLSVAWLATTGLLALVGLGRLIRHRRGPLAEVCIAAGLVYGVVGSGWAFLDRWGVRPLHFEPVIVLLTAIHFHYAGLLLPTLTGLALREVDGLVGRVAAVGAIIAVPLVAVGITATQMQMGPWLELAAAWIMASAGLATGWLYLRLARQRRWQGTVRTLWTLAALSLILGMILAALYGSRFLLAVDWLDIPWMRAVHGTANALGFTLAALVGWCLSARSSAA